MEGGLEKVLSDFLFNRDPEALKNNYGLVDPDEITKAICEKLKEEIKTQLQEEPEKEESSFIRFDDLSNEFMFMAMNNWRLLLFRNKQSIIDVIKFYKVITSLIHMYDGLNSKAEDLLQLDYSLNELKKHLVLIQKWMIFFLNSLEVFILNIVRKERNFSNFDKNIYMSYTYFKYSFNSVYDFLSKSSNDRSPYSVSQILIKEAKELYCVMDSLLIQEYITLMKEAGKEKQFTDATKAIQYGCNQIEELLKRKYYDS